MVDNQRMALHTSPDPSRTPPSLPAQDDRAAARDRRLMETTRWVIVAVGGGMFLFAANMAGPRGSSAADPRRPAPAKPAAARSTTPAPEGRKFLGELRGRDYTVRIDLTPDGTRYTVLKDGELAATDLSGEELASRFPDLDTAGLKAEPSDSGALMLVDPNQDH